MRNANRIPASPDRKLSARAWHTRRDDRWQAPESVHSREFTTTLCKNLTQGPAIQLQPIPSIPPPVSDADLADKLLEFLDFYWFGQIRHFAELAKATNLLVLL